MDNPDLVPNARPKRILVIGGGASGLVTLRNLRERGDFEDVQLVERRDDVGGVWYLDADSDPPRGAPRWPSPAYPGLIGNVLPEFLSFSSFRPFPEPPSTAAGQPFPTLAETHAYLHAFAAPLLTSGAIRLNTEVLAVEELHGRTGWRVRMGQWSGQTSRTAEELWDVACYDHPVFPTTPGLARLHELGLAHHAQRWRGPQAYEGQRLLVVGNANSGNDMAAQLAPVARAVYQSIRRPNFPGFPSLPDPRITRVAPSQNTSSARRRRRTSSLTPALRTAQSSATSTACSSARATAPAPILSASCHPMAPWSRSCPHPPPPPSSSPSPSPPSPPTPTIPHLHRYTLYARNPSLAFVGTAFACYTPFTVADMCSTWLALAWSPGANAITYPTSLRALLAFEGSRLAAVECGRAEMSEAADGKEASSLVTYGVLGPFEEEFADALREEVVRVRPELGAVLPVWSQERTAVREAMFGLKRRALEIARMRGDEDRITE